MTDAGPGLDESHASGLFIHPDALRYDFGPHHPLRPLRLTALLDLIAARDPRPAREYVEEPAPATLEDLSLVHTSDYLDAVQRIDDELSDGQVHVRLPVDRYGLGQGDTPAFAGMHEASAAIAGATQAAVGAVLDGRLSHAFSPSGGLHHAMAARASGFCIYNDPALGIAQALKRDPGLRVLYLDFDAHHGDGVQTAFYTDPRVLTVSFHESGRSLFPGTGGMNENGRGAGLGYSLNLPFAPFTDDEDWLAAVDAIVPAAFERFRPDLVVSQHGCDGHAWDPLTHLLLTTWAFHAQTSLVHRLAHEHCSGRWVACGGGGYDPLRVVPRAWAHLWGEMTGNAPQGPLPHAWWERWSGLVADGEMPPEWDDPEDAVPAIPRRAAIRQQNLATLQEATVLLSRILPGSPA